MSTEITCSKCGMRMTAEQEALMVRCLVVDCPLPNASAAGRAYAEAPPKDRSRMRGLIIGSPDFPHYQMQDDSP